LRRETDNGVDHAAMPRSLEEGLQVFRIGLSRAIYRAEIDERVALCVSYAGHPRMFSCS
jgi:hypothetical protein